VILLSVNSGSSSLKLDFLDVEIGKKSELVFSKLASGIIDRKSKEVSFRLHTSAADLETKKVTAADTEEAFSKLIGIFKEASFGSIEAVGHRLVHGGDQFVFPTLLSKEVLAALAKLRELAPLHNEEALHGIALAKSHFGEKIPMVAVFDTAFHHDIPLHASTYALPKKWREKHKIKRYGFHGLAHDYMMKRYCELTNTPQEKAALVTFQLGNGASACAIREGRSIDTSMGFTPLEGLVMGTRSGNIDPSIATYLVKKENLDAKEMERILNQESGLLALSEKSSDMRDLIAIIGKNSNAALAVEVFCYHAKKFLGAYLAVLGDAQAVVFGGGIGEHIPLVRAKICEGMQSLGVALDSAANQQMVGQEGNVAAKGSKVGAYVVRVDESRIIAEETLKCLLHH